MPAPTGWAGLAEAAQPSGPHRRGLQKGTRPGPCPSPAKDRLPYWALPRRDSVSPTTFPGSQALGGSPTHRGALRPGHSEEGGELGSTQRPHARASGGRAGSPIACLQERGTETPLRHPRRGTPCLSPQPCAPQAARRRRERGKLTGHPGNSCRAAMTQQFWFRCVCPALPPAPEAPRRCPLHPASQPASQAPGPRPGGPQRPTSANP